MPKRVFFSFHYQDVADFRANVVRNHWRTKPDRDSAGYFDASVWEKAKKEGPLAIKRLINGALQNTSNTCVLIGSETFARLWVRYEIFKSLVCGNNIFGVHINGIPDKYRQTRLNGPNPFEYLGITISDDGSKATLWHRYDKEWVYFDLIDGSAQVPISWGRQFGGKAYILSQLFSTHDWVRDNGYDNFPSWVE